MKGCGRRIYSGNTMVGICGRSPSNPYDEEEYREINYCDYCIHAKHVHNAKRGEDDK